MTTTRPLTRSLWKPLTRAPSDITGSDNPIITALNFFDAKPAVSSGLKYLLDKDGVLQEHPADHIAGEGLRYDAGSFYITDSSGDPLYASSQIQTQAGAVSRYGAVIPGQSIYDFYPGGRIEGPSTNVFYPNNNLSNARWIKTNTTINAAIGADGQTANLKIIPLLSGGTPNYISQSLTSPLNYYTISALVKPDGHNVVFLYILNSGSYGMGYVDLNTLQTQVVSGSVSTGSVGVLPIGDWFLVWYTAGTQISINSGSGIGVCDALGSTSVTASGTDGVIASDLQLEAGLFPTSRIKTTTSTVTRPADIATDDWPTGVANDFFKRLTVRPLGVQAGSYVFASRSDADNLVAIILNASDITFRKRKAGTNTDVTVSYTHGTDMVDVEVYQHSTGMGIRYRAYNHTTDTWGSWSAWSEITTAAAQADAVPGTVICYGALYNGTTTSSHCQGNYIWDDVGEFPVGTADPSAYVETLT